MATGLALERAIGILKVDLETIPPKDRARVISSQQATIASVLSAQVRVDGGSLKGRPRDQLANMLEKVKQWKRPA